MHRYCRLLLGSAAAVALISGATMLTATEASAQINIEGLIRGAMHSYYGGGGYYRHHRGRVHESSHERRSKKHEEAKDDEDNKGGSKDNHGSSGHQTADKDSSDRASSDKGSSAVPAANTSSQKQQPVADVPNLTPER